MSDSPLVSVVIPAYNPGPELLLALERLKAQSAAAGIEILVVDDGSDSGFPELPQQDGQVRCLRLAQNQGRAAARNAGAAAARGSYLIFLDCDRLPIPDRFIASHLAPLQSGADGTCGPINAVGNGFWARYQRSVPVQLGELVPLHRFSSANFGMRRSLFEAVGGFDSRYRRYGFEDRDLYLRLLQRGHAFVFAPDAQAWHTDTLDLRRVWEKMVECGAGGSAVFRQLHPEAYRQMRYWWFDAREHRSLRHLSPTLARFLTRRLDSAQRVLDHDGIPYPLRRALAQAYSAAAFMKGSAESS